MHELKLTASKMALARKCAHWLGFDDPNGPTTPPQVFGSLVHNIVAWSLSTHSDPMHENEVACDYARRALECINDNGWRVLGYERTLGLDPYHRTAWDATGMCMASDGTESLDYQTRDRRPARAGELPGYYGTADLIIQDRTGSIGIVDWKTGSHVSARDNAQLTHLATAYRLHCDNDIPIIGHIVVLRRYGYSIDSSVVTSSDMDRHVSTLADIGRDWFDDTPNPGPQCHYCPHVDKCGGPYRSDEAQGEEVHTALARLYKRMPRDESERTQRVNVVQIDNAAKMEVLMSHLSTQEMAAVVQYRYDFRHARKMVGSERAARILQILQELDNG